MPSPRKNPVRILQSSLTGRIYAVTAYTISEDGSNLVARTKHDVTDDVRELIAHAMEAQEAMACLCGEEGRCVCGAKARAEFLASRAP